MSSIQSISATQPFTASNSYTPKKRYTGAATGAAFSMFSLVLNSVALAKGRSKFPEFLKHIAKRIPIYIGSGFIVDCLNNKQRESRPHNTITPNGSTYTKVNRGKTFGAGLGLLSGSILYFINKNRIKVPDFLSKMALASCLAVSAAGGHLLGSITDKIANNKTAKEADSVSALSKEKTPKV